MLLFFRMPRYQRWCKNVSKKERILKKAINRMRWSEMSMDRLDKVIDHLKDIRDVKRLNQLRTQLKKRGETPQFLLRRYPTLEYSSSEYETESSDNDLSELSAPTSNGSPPTSDDDTLNRPSSGMSTPLQHETINLGDTDVPDGTAPNSPLSSPRFNSDESANNSDYSARINPLYNTRSVPWIIRSENSSTSEGEGPARKQSRLEDLRAGVDDNRPGVELARPNASEPTDVVPAVPHGDSPDDDSTR